MLPDESFPQILAAAQSGAAWGFTRLYEDLRGQVVTFVRLRGARDPDDVTSEVFLNVFQGLGTFAGDQMAFRAWVFTIARRRVIDALRADQARPATVPITPADDPTHEPVEADAFAAIGLGRLTQLLDDLTPQQREVLLLRFVADLSLEDVAQVTGRTVGAIKALQNRAVRRMRRMLSDQAVSR